MRNCYISRNYKTTKSGGGRVRTDLETIMTEMGFKNLGLPQSRHSNMVFDFFYTFTSVMKALLTMRKGDTLLVQYPMKKYYEFVCNVAHRRGVKVITVIHDLGCFRRKKLTVEREMKRLAHSDVIMLPRMDKHMLDPRIGLQRTAKRRNLHKIRASPDNGHNLHFRTPSKIEI